jgi:hypothetical protein
MLDKLKQELNSKVTVDNLLDENILKLSQQLDVEIVKDMRKEAR